MNRIKRRQGTTTVSVQETVMIWLEGNRELGVQRTITYQGLGYAHACRWVDYNKRMNRVCGQERGPRTRRVNPQV